MCVKNLVASIIQFLTKQLDDGNITSDSRESLEVAIQCLESAYNVQASDASASIDLLELYKAADVNNMSSTSSSTTTTTTSPPLPPEASPEAKAKAEALKNEGNQLMKLEKYEEALANYTKAIELDGRNAVYYGNRAAVYSKLGNHFLAIKDSHTALEIDPSYSKAYGRLGLAFSSLNKHKEARDAYKKALEMEPDNESYKSNLQLAEEQLAQSGNGGRGMLAMDIMSLMSNPTLVNIAQQMLNEPAMQNLMRNYMTGDNGQDGRIDAIFQAGQRLVQTVQNSNPEIIETIVREMNQNQNPDSPQQN